MPQLSDIKKGLDQYKVSLTRQQEQDLANRQYFESLVTQLSNEVKGAQRDLVAEIMRNIPEAVDLTPVTNALESLSRASQDIMDAIGSITVPKTDLSGIESKLAELVQEKEKSDWTFDVKYDSADRPKTINARPMK